MDVFLHTVGGYLSDGQFEIYWVTTPSDPMTITSLLALNPISKLWLFKKYD
ncbi:MAG: hypothetical protein WC480_02765 [Patescibacteria group bacterium]